MIVLFLQKHCLYRVRLLFNAEQFRIVQYIRITTEKYRSLVLIHNRTSRVVYTLPYSRTIWCWQCNNRMFKINILNHIMININIFELRCFCRFCFVLCNFRSVDNDYSNIFYSYFPELGHFVVHTCFLDFECLSVLVPRWIGNVQTSLLMMHVEPWKYKGGGKCATPPPKKKKPVRKLLMLLYASGS